MPGMSSDGDTARHRDGLSVRTVRSRDRTSINIGHPDHDFVSCRTSRGGGCEHVVGYVGDYGSGGGLAPCPGRLSSTPRYNQSSFTPHKSTRNG